MLPPQGALVLSLVGKLRSHKIPHVVWCGQKKKKALSRDKQKRRQKITY